MQETRKTITICGSMKFAEQMRQISSVLEAKGYAINIPDEGGSGVSYDALDEAEQVILKGRFINDHLEYIKESDAILVANFEKRGISGYIGTNTLMEIAFAYVLKKQIFVLNRVGEQSCKLEVLGMQPLILNGNIEGIEGSLKNEPN